MGHFIPRIVVKLWVTSGKSIFLDLDMLLVVFRRTVESPLLRRLPLRISSTLDQQSNCTTKHRIVFIRQMELGYLIISADTPTKTVAGSGQNWLTFWTTTCELISGKSFFRRLEKRSSLCSPSEGSGGDGTKECVRKNVTGKSLPKK